jgi:uncharacterized membrane protein
MECRQSPEPTLESKKHEEEMTKTSERNDLTVQHRGATSLMVLLGSIAAILIYLMILGLQAYLPMPMKKELEVEMK